MAITATSTNTLSLLNILNRNSADRAATFKQLATGLRINAAKERTGLPAIAGVQQRAPEFRDVRGRRVRQY